MKSSFRVKKGIKEVNIYIRLGKLPLVLLSSRFKIAQNTVDGRATNSGEEEWHLGGSVLGDVAVHVL